MPGAGKQPPEIQENIRELLEAGFDPTTIHRKLKVGRSSIYRMRRCLKKHGTAYMPVEMNKKNGRPKVLTAEQELEVRDWLRDPKNRTRYLDDLVWLIHDRFGIVCSTTTMSKMKRKWVQALEAEETGQPLDEATRLLIIESHPDLPILHQQQAPVPTAQMIPPQPQGLQHQHHQHDLQHHDLQQHDLQRQHQHQQQELQYPHSVPEPQIDAALHDQSPLDARLQQHAELAQHHHQLDSELQRQIQQEMAKQRDLVSYES